MSGSKEYEDVESRIPLDPFVDGHEPVARNEKDYDIVKSRNWCNPAPAVFVFVSVICLALSVTSFYIYFTQARPQNVNNICVTCSVLFSKPIKNRHLQNVQSRAYANNHTKCCAQNSEEMSAMLEYLLPEQGVQSHNAETMALTLSAGSDSEKRFGYHAGAHKQLRYEPKFRFQREPDFSGPFPLIVSAKNNKYEYANQVQLVEKGITVEHPGLYHVYMSIYFNTLGNCKNYRQQTFRAAMYRSNLQNPHSPPEELLNLETSCCKTCKRNSDSNFGGGQFLLDAGDVIHVKVSAYGVVFISNDVTYMGLYMLGRSKT